MPDPTYRVEALAAHHDRAAFSCGNAELDAYLRMQASPDARKKVAAPFVAVVEGTQTVAGYYTLSSLSVPLGNLPQDVAKKLPRYPDVPVTLLGRLAVDTQHQGRGLGEFLLMNSLDRSLVATQQVASFAVIVDAIDDKAVSFYRYFEFIPFPDYPRRLFLPVETIKVLLGPPSQTMGARKRSTCRP